MANLVAGSIALTFKSLNKGVKKGIDETKSSLGGLKSAAANTSKVIGPAMAAAAATGAAGIAAGVGLAIKEYGEFESLLTNVSTLISGDATEALKDYKDGILEITKTVPKDADELGAGLYDIVSAGVEGTNAQLATLKSSAKLAVAGLGDTAGAVDLMTSSINAFGLDANNSDKIADTLFKTVKFGKTTVDGLRQGFGGVAPAAAAAGVKIEELMAATSALTTTGLPAAEAYTQLKASFGELTKPGAALKKQLEKIGITNAKAAIEADGYDTVLNKLYDSVGNDTVALKNLFGSMEAGAAAVSLVDTVSGSYKTTLDEMTAGSNALDEANEKQNQTWGNFVQLLKNQVNAALIELGSVVVPLLMEGLTALGDVVGPLYSGLREDFGEFSLQLEGVAPIFDSVKEKATEIFEYLEPFIKEAFHEIGRAVDEAKDLFAYAMPFIEDLVEHTLRVFTPIFKRIAEEIIPLIGPAIQDLIRAFKAILPFIMPILKFMVDKMGNTFNLMVTIIKSFIQVASGLLQLIQGIFTGNFQKMGEGIKNIFSGIFGAIGGIIMSAIRGIANNINSGIRQLNNMINRLPDIPGMGSVPNIPEIPAFAKGVRNFSGGVALVGEEGPELVNLPSGSDVYTNDDTKSMLGGANITIELIINTMLPDEEMIDTALDTLIPKLRNKLQNI